MLSATELEIRRGAIGASDAAAVLGIDRYRTAFQVWAEKVGRLDAFEGNAATDAGNRFEPAILNWAEEQLGPMYRNIRRSIDGKPIASTLDGLLFDTGEPVEAKTAGLFGALHEDWGDEGTDAVPLQYVVQCQVQMLCVDAGVAHLAAFLGGKGFRLYRIERSEKVCDHVANYLPEWWDRHVVRNVPPPAENVSVEVLRRLRRDPGLVTDVSPETARRFESAREAMKAAEKEKKEAEKALLDELGLAEAAEFGDDERWLTYFQQTRRAYHVEEAKFRVLRFSKRSKE